jgi:hypothetical protein
MASKPPIDLSEYELDEAAVDAMIDKAAKYNKNVDPKLLARLQELKLRTSAPDLTPPAPPSVAVYVPPTAVRPGAKPREGAAKVELPPAASEYPTQPSLKRLASEPEVPGVAKARLVSARPVSWKGAALAVLAIVAPLVVVISLLGRCNQSGAHAETAAPTTATGSTSATMPLTAPPASASVAPAAAVSAVPAASATASAAAPAGSAPRPKPRGAMEDPYDAAPLPSTTAAPSSTPPATSAEQPTQLPKIID